MKQDEHRTTGLCSALPVGKPVHISFAGDEVLVIVEQLYGNLGPGVL